MHAVFVHFGYAPRELCDSSTRFAPDRLRRPKVSVANDVSGVCSK